MDSGDATGTTNQELVWHILLALFPNPLPVFSSNPFSCSLLMGSATSCGRDSSPLLPHCCMKAKGSATAEASLSLATAKSRLFAVNRKRNLMRQASHNYRGAAGSTATLLLLKAKLARDGKCYC